MRDIVEEEHGTDVRMKFTRNDFQRIRTWGASHGHTRLGKCVTALVRKALEAEGL